MATRRHSLLIKNLTLNRPVTFGWKTKVQDNNKIQNRYSSARAAIDRKLTPPALLAAILLLPAVLFCC